MRLIESGSHFFHDLAYTAMKPVVPFNNMVDEMLQKFIAAYPQEDSFREAWALFQTAKSIDEAAPMTFFWQAAEPLGQLIQTQDLSLFEEVHKIVPPQGQPLFQAIYKVASMDVPGQLDAIFAYLRDLYQYAQLCSLLPPEAQNVIDQATEQIANSIDGASGTGFPSGLVDMLSKFLMQR